MVVEVATGEHDADSLSLLLFPFGHQPGKGNRAGWLGEVVGRSIQNAYGLGTDVLADLDHP